MQSLADIFIEMHRVRSTIGSKHDRKFHLKKLRKFRQVLRRTAAIEARIVSGRPFFTPFVR